MYLYLDRNWSLQVVVLNWGYNCNRIDISSLIQLLLPMTSTCGTQVGWVWLSCLCLITVGYKGAVRLKHNGWDWRFEVIMINFRGSLHLFYWHLLFYDISVEYYKGYFIHVKLYAENIVEWALLQLTGKDEQVKITWLFFIKAPSQPEVNKYLFFTE